MRREECGGLPETKTNERALIPHSADRSMDEVSAPKRCWDNFWEMTMIARANANVAATHNARKAKADSVSFPL
jgi:hypothetical protein